METSKIPHDMKGRQRQFDRAGRIGFAERDLHPLMWLGLPVGSVLLCWLAPLMGYPRWKAFIEDEQGIIETLTAIFLIPAIVLSVLIFLRRRRMPRPVGWIMLLAGVAALYFLGEETSWGQHWFGFQTPPAIAKLNKQGECNLHNIPGWHLSNNIPRQTMLMMCLVGGVVLPLAGVRKKWFAGPEAGPNVWYWLIPTWRLVPAALLASCATLPEKAYKLWSADSAALPREGYLRMAFIEPAGEFKEYCFALVILLYLLSVYLRTGAGTRAPHARQPTACARHEVPGG